jgi:hypothetical protein
MKLLKRENNGTEMTLSLGDQSLSICTSIELDMNYSFKRGLTFTAKTDNTSYTCRNPIDAVFIAFDKEKEMQRGKGDEC